MEFYRLSCPLNKVDYLHIVLGLNHKGNLYLLSFDQGQGKIEGGCSVLQGHDCPGIFLFSPGKGKKVLTVLVQRHTEKRQDTGSLE